MKIKLTQLLALTALCISSGAFAQNNGDYRSITSGNYSATTTWERYDSVTATWIAPATKPGSGNNVTVKSGHIVTMDAGSSTHNAKALTIESSATLKSDGLAQRTLRVYGPALTNNGTLGGGVGADSITLESAQATGAVNFTGSGTTQVNRTRAYYGVKTNVTFDQNISVNYKGAGAFTAYYNNSSSSSADSVTFNLNAGRTITFNDSAAFHATSSATANPGGLYVYNINGTLDMSHSNGTTHIVPSSQTSSSIVTINIGGTMKLGYGFNTSNSAPGANNGTINLNILAGGVVDASATRRLTTDSQTFVMASGTSVFKRVVSTTDTAFPISIASKGFNTVTMSNSGTADTFSIKLQGTFGQTTPDATKLVNRQWTISEATTGGTTANIKFNWLAAVQASGFSPASVSVYRYAGGHWKEYPATVTGSGTLAAPYAAAITGVDTMGIFIVGNSGIPLPTSGGVGIAGIQSASGSMMIAPNPVMGGSIQLQLAGLETGNYNIAVYSMTGQVVAQDIVAHAGKSSARAIQLPANAAGLYEVRISNGKVQLAQRIVVE